MELTCPLQVEHSLGSPVSSLKESLQPEKRRKVNKISQPSPPSGVEQREKKKERRGQGAGEEKAESGHPMQWPCSLYLVT